MATPNDASVAKRSAAHIAKNETFCKIFSLPNTERVVQDYRCSIKGSVTGGKLYVSTNYVCYASHISSYIEKIPYRKLDNISKESSTFFTYLKLEAQGQVYLFSGFYGNHLEEAYTVINYLWKNPPSYIELKFAVPEPPKPAALAPSSFEYKRPTIESNPFGSQTYGDWGEEPESEFNSAENRFSGVHNPVWGDQQQTATPQVDLVATKEALRLAKETERLGADTLATLAAQGEQIDRIENRLDQMHVQLDKGHQILRDCDSLLAYIGHSIYNPKNKRKIHQGKDRSMAIIQGKSPLMDIEILYKKPDDSLVPSVLVLDGDFFTFVDPLTDTPVDPQKYLYSSIHSVVMRARPEHCDIRFNPSAGANDEPRVRIMSSYLQIITNELVLRANDNKHEIKVIFEPAVPAFDYGNPRVSATAPVSSRDSGVSFFQRDNVLKTSSLLSSHASQETRDALDAADQDLDEISHILGNIGQQSVIMGTELDRQNEQLNAVNQKAASATHRLETDIRQIDYLKS